jgi:hypothetical protein
LVKIKASRPWQHLPARAKRIELVMQPFATQHWSRREGQSATDDADEALMLRRIAAAAARLQAVSPAEGEGVH